MPSYTYQWRRCDSGGASCSDIGGATSATYAVVTGDIGSTLRCVVSDGTTTVTSAQSAVVQAAVSGVPYEYLDFETSFPPSGWTASTFFNSPTGSATASYAQVADPLGTQGNVLRLSCPYTSGQVTSYANNGTCLQQSALSVNSKSQAHAANGDETWYRYKFMFPSGNRFCNGFSNFLIEWHTNATGPLSPGLFAYGDYPLTSGGTTTPKLVFVMRSGNISSPTQKFYPGATSTVEASSGITITNNHYYDCVFHIKWDDTGSGLFEWWMDGSLIVSAAGATYYTDPTELLGMAVYNYRFNVTGDSNVYYALIANGPTSSSIGFTP